MSDVLASIEAQDAWELLSLKQKITNLSTEKTIQLNFFSSYPDNIICNEKSLLNFHKWSHIFKLKKVFKYYKPFQWNFMYNVTLSLSLSLSFCSSCWRCLVKSPMLLMRAECYSNTPDPLQHVQCSEVWDMGPRSTWYGTF